MERIYLSKRNLLVLLSKLERKAKGEETACTIVKYHNPHPHYEQTLDEVMVTAVPDEDYYDREPGAMHPSDEPVKQ